MISSNAHLNSRETVPLTQYLLVAAKDPVFRLHEEKRASQDLEGAPDLLLPASSHLVLVLGDTQQEEEEQWQQGVWLEEQQGEHWNAREEEEEE